MEKSRLKFKKTRLPNIGQEEANEIGHLAVRLFMTEKHLWGNTFWKTIEKKGAVLFPLLFGFVYLGILLGFDCDYG